MNGANHATQDTNANNEELKQSNAQIERTREEKVAELIQIINDLFDANNIVYNSYLIKRARNEKFEIPVQVIYSEKSVRRISDDQEIVNEALEKSENVMVNKKDNIIQAVSLKNNEPRRKITVQNITRDKRDTFKQFVTSLQDVKEESINWNFNKLNFANIICKDEETASNLYKIISTLKFEEQDLDCSLNNDNIYISALENLKRRTRNYMNPQNQMDYINYMNPMNPMNPQNQMYYNNMMGFNPYMGGYPMNTYFAGTSNNYLVTNNYRNMNHYYQTGPAQNNYAKPHQQGQNGSYTKKPFNNNNNNVMNNNNQNYNNDKKGYSKKNKQFREKNYKYNGNKANARTSNVEVNDNEFPPL